MTPVDEEDLTRKQRREQAREQRKAAEAAAAADATRKRRLTQLGIVVAVVVVAVVVILIATGGGGKPAGEKGPSQAQVPAIAKQVNAELEGVPQSGRTIGSPTAPVTLQYFGDLQCPICKQFSNKSGALPKLIAGPVKEGKVRIEFMNLQTATRDPEIFQAQQKAALAAGKQNKAWNYIELFYNEQREEGTEYVNEAYLQGLAKQIPGLNLGKWSSDRNDPKLEAEVQTDAQLANNDGLTGTPAFLIGHSGGAMKKYEWSTLTDPKPYEEAIEKAAKA